MLVLSRKEGESVRVGKDIWVTVLEIRGNKIRLGIEAPDDQQIARGELAERWTIAEDPQAAEGDAAGALSLPEPLDVAEFV